MYTLSIYIIKCGIVEPTFPGWSEMLQLEQPGEAGGWSTRLPAPAPLPSLPPLPPAHCFFWRKSQFMPHFLNLQSGQGWLSEPLHHLANVKIFSSLRATSEAAWANGLLSEIVQKAIFSKKGNAGFLPSGLLGQIAHFWELCCSCKVLHDAVNAQGLEESLGCLWECL